MEVITTTALMLMRIEVGVFTGLNCFAFQLIGTILYSISVIITEFGCWKYKQSMLCFVLNLSADLFFLYLKVIVTTNSSNQSKIFSDDEQ